MAKCIAFLLTLRTKSLCEINVVCVVSHVKCSKKCAYMWIFYTGNGIFINDKLIHYCVLTYIRNSLPVWSKSTELESLKSTVFGSLHSAVILDRSHMCKYTRTKITVRGESRPMYTFTKCSQQKHFAVDEERVMSLFERRLLRQSNWQKIEHLSIPFALLQGEKTHTKMCNTVVTYYVHTSDRTEQNKAWNKHRVDYCYSNTTWKLG